MPHEETLEGYVVDIACLRRYPSEEMLQRAREHTVACATMGHCVESGYGMVDRQGRVHLLEAAATPRVLDNLRQTRERGIRMRMQRREEDGEMKTQTVEAIG